MPLSSEWPRSLLLSLGAPSRPTPRSCPGPVQVPSRVRGGPVQIRHVLCFIVFRTHPGPEVGAVPTRPGPILLPSVPPRIGSGRAETDFLATSENCSLFLICYHSCTLPPPRNDEHNDSTSYYNHFRGASNHYILNQDMSKWHFPVCSVVSTALPLSRRRFPCGFALERAVNIDMLCSNLTATFNFQMFGTWSYILWSKIFAIARPHQQPLPKYIFWRASQPDYLVRDGVWRGF